MNAFTMPSSFSVPYATIDDERRSLVELLNRLTAHADGTADATLDRDIDGFLTALRAHFDSDEQLMREVYYPKRIEHRAAHRACADRIEAVLDRARVAGGIDRATLGDVFAILVDVIARVDLYFKEYLIGIGRLRDEGWQFGGTAAPAR